MKISDYLPVIVYALESATFIELAVYCFLMIVSDGNGIMIAGVSG